MLIQFKSDAYENITMFGDIAIHLLKMMGQSGVVPGALKAEEIPEALASLEKSLYREYPLDNEENLPEDDDNSPPIHLSQRAFPLINMLKSAQEKNCSIIWQKQ
ncbi:DUF1840 domain-containing protein [Legionella spiritensis]|uniref:DUF1840 domain-containing protein n=1 Tax=Legionella spiritensis TaxID=452 RepID=UPI000F71F23E|nr:DUF1840 domain-containing protein [Legionella spiritensis]VEG90244.1 Domain of uncharacterised function (DUF1840) [Legionella spiritensis]